MGIWEKLRLEPERHRVVALVGAGGKTSTLFALAREARAAGLTAIVTTTTHIRPHPRLPLTGETDGEKLRALVDAQGVVVCGRREPTGKLTLAAAVETCRRAADVVLVEADGAKMLPLKAPAEHEPAIPPCADAVVAVAGLDGWDRPWRPSATGRSGCGPCWARGRGISSPRRMWPPCWPTPRGGARGWRRAWPSAAC